MQGTAAYQQGGAVFVGGVVACAGDVGLEYKVSIRLDNARTNLLLKFPACLQYVMKNVLL